ncbi:hypothetical protein [Bradyrhizobium diazoefficiens]
MLMRILAALGRAFAWLFGLPGRLLGGLFGGSLTPPPAGDSPLVADLKEELAARQGEDVDHAKDARLVLLWCADSIVADRPVPVPSSLPRVVKEWLKGLSRDECELVISWEKTAISAHIRKLYALPGVRPVQPLPAAKWAPAPATVAPAPDFVLAPTPRPGA